jgi:hypothetical protein
MQQSIKGRHFILAAVLMVQAGLRAQLPVITNQPTSRALWAGGNVTFSVGVSGTGPFTYQWQLNGTSLSNGIIATVAGTGTAGSSGDGGAATNAQLNGPSGLVLDASGDLFIADYLETVSARSTPTGTSGLSLVGGAPFGVMVVPLPMAW